MVKAYVCKLEDVFRSNEKPEIAVQMKKYMRDQYEYFGLKAPVRRELFRNFLKEEGLPPDEKIEDVARRCWESEFREIHYAGQEILGKHMKKAPKERIDLYEFLITRNSWWDTVDYIAPTLCGTHFQRFPELISEYTGRWIESDNFWLQRSAIIFQLKYKASTDKELLYKYIRRRADETEFFVRKAIGWALREYSKTDAEAVKTFVEATPMSGLSRREALKRITNI